MLLWFVLAVLTAATLVYILWPLSRSEQNALPRNTFDAAVYRDQLSEIEADLSRGLLGQEEAEAAKVEISRRILAAAGPSGDKDTGDISGAGKTASPTTLMIAVAVFIPISSLILYLSYGMPGLPDQPRAARVKAPAGKQKFDELIASVEQKLRVNPEDGMGWDVIAPVYLKFGRYDDAADAFSRAIRLRGEDKRRLFGFAEATRLANNGIITEQARKAFAKAAARDPDFLAARFRLAVAMEQDGRFDDAVREWQAILAKAPSDIPWRGELEERLKVARSKAKRDKGTAAKKSAERPSIGHKKQNGAQATMPKLTREQISSAQNMSADQQTAMINNMVARLADRLKNDGSDLKGWLRLVRAYTVLGKRDEAVKALSAARKALLKNKDALAQLDSLAKQLGLGS